MAGLKVEEPKAGGAMINYLEENFLPKRGPAVLLKKRHKNDKITRKSLKKRKNLYYKMPQNGAFFC